MMAYSSTIVKASQDFEGTPWLEYDVHFRRQIATQKEQSWERIDASIWTLCFTRATPKGGEIPRLRETAEPLQVQPLSIAGVL